MRRIAFLLGAACIIAATPAAASSWLSDAQRRAFAFDKETARSFAEGIVRNLAAHHRDEIEPDKLDFAHPLMLSGQQLPPAEMRFITVAFPAIKGGKQAYHVLFAVCSDNNTWIDLSVENYGPVAGVDAAHQELDDISKTNAIGVDPCPEGD